MNNIKSCFTIKDLENISAISTHTIRIWERRYQLFQPERTANNTRFYKLEDLQYLLNIDLLRKRGLKISEIADYSKEEAFSLAKNIVEQSLVHDYALMELKMAMYSYDEYLFEKMYKKLRKENSFSTIFRNVFSPFLNYLGLFWQTKTITIAHEHFITNLIYQKIQLNIAKLKKPTKSPSNSTFVLYLPEEEMHEIGLLYLNYELKSEGYQTVYLGRSVPLEDLASLKSIYPAICWIGCFVFTPKPKVIENYFSKIKILLTSPNHEYWAIGHGFPSEYNIDLPEKLLIFNSIKEVLEKIALLSN